MSRRGSNIFKRKDGRWEGRYKSGVKEDGHAKYSSVYARSYSDCAIKLRSAKEHSAVIGNTPTVRELFNVWICNRKNSIKQSTYSSYRSLYENYIDKSLGGLRADRISAVGIADFTDNLIVSGGKSGKPLSTVTVQTIVVLLKSVFRFGMVEYGICDPFKAVVMPKADFKEVQVFDESHITKIKNSCDIHDLCSVGVLLTLYTGMRIGELCALKWDDIDLANGTIKVSKTLCRIKNPSGDAPKTIIVITPPKSKKSLRSIPIPSCLIPMLSELKCHNSGEDYFLTGCNKYTEPRAFSEKYKHYLKRIGVPYKNYHVLRHTFATACIRQGVDVKTVSELLGHSSVKITLEKYVHPDMDMKRTQLEKLYSYL